MEIKIKSTTSAMPENASKATLLEIEEASASAMDVFQILTNYPKIKKVRIGGTEYKREQIGKLGLGDRLGAGTARRNGWDGLGDILAPPDPIFQRAPADQARAGRGRGIYEQLIESTRAAGQWVQTPPAALPADILGGYVEPEQIDAGNITNAQVATPTPAQLRALFMDTPLPTGTFEEWTLAAPTATAQEVGEEEAPW